MEAPSDGLSGHSLETASSRSDRQNPNFRLNCSAPMAGTRRTANQKSGHRTKSGRSTQGKGCSSGFSVTLGFFLASSVSSCSVVGRPEVTWGGRYLQAKKTPAAILAVGVMSPGLVGMGCSSPWSRFLAWLSHPGHPCGASVIWRRV